MSTIYFAGVPTDPDVDKIMDKLGVPKAETLVAYESVAGIITEDIGSTRFKSVTNAWRKRLYLKHNLVLKAVPKKGWSVLNDGQRITFSTTKYKHGLRHVRRAADVAAKTDGAKLSAEDSRVRDHIVGTASMLQLAAATEARKLKYATPEKKK